MSSFSGYVYPNKTLKNELEYRDLCKKNNYRIELNMKTDTYIISWI